MEKRPNLRRLVLVDEAGNEVNVSAQEFQAATQAATPQIPPKLAHPSPAPSPSRGHHSPRPVARVVEAPTGKRLVKVSFVEQTEWTVEFETEASMDDLEGGGWFAAMDDATDGRWQCWCAACKHSGLPEIATQEVTGRELVDIVDSRPAPIKARKLLAGAVRR